MCNITFLFVSYQPQTFEQYFILLAFRAITANYLFNIWEK